MADQESALSAKIDDISDRLAALERAVLALLEALEEEPAQPLIDLSGEPHGLPRETDEPLDVRSLSDG